MDLSMTALLGITGEATLWTNVISVAWRVLLVLLGVNMLVIVHEFGHFIVARMCGVRCDKFYIWFDAYGFKLFSFKWGDTEYGLGWVPLGGYVKMLGQEDNPSHIQEEIEKAKLEKKEEGEESQGALEEQSRVQTTSDKDYIKKLEEQLYAPDSYLAKNVFQRMAIISAGVIMNIIFAVICATGAALIGTHETSAKIGYVAPGSAAWNADLQPGDEIVAIGDNTKPIFSSILVACMDRKEIELKVRKPGQDAVESVFVTPRIDAGALTPMIGVGPSPSLQIAEVSDHKPFETVFDPQALENGKKSFEKFSGGERLISMNNIPVSTPADYIRLCNLFINQPVEYTFAHSQAPQKGAENRANDDSFTISLSPVKAPDIGVRLTMGEIIEIKPNSAAEKAGLRSRKLDAEGNIVQRGDILLEIDNEPILDPMTFPYKIFSETSRESFEGLLGTKAELKAPNLGDEKREAPSPLSSKTLLLTVNRDGNRVDVPVALPKVAPYGGLTAKGGVMACDSLGLVYQVTPVISGVDASCSYESNPFGGVVTEIETFISDPGANSPVHMQEIFKSLTGVSSSKENEGQKFNIQWKTTAAIDDRVAIENDGSSISWLLSTLPYVPDGAPVKVSFVGLGGEEGVLKTVVKRTGDAYLTDRGLLFGVDSVFQSADNLKDALAFGVDKTYEAASQVFIFLKNVGKNVSAKALGGPGMIVGTAYEAAGRDDGVFLLFLCLISANLAVVNFLPIPVLDGGHMVFLIYEAITRRKPNEKIQIALSYVGLALILGLMFWVVFLDVLRYCF